MGKRKTFFILYLLRWIVKYFTYGPLMGVVLTGVAFLVIAWINFSTGEPTLKSLGMFLPILKWLGIGESGHYGNKEIWAAFTKASTVVGVAGLAIEYFLKKVFGFELRVGRWVGFVYISALFVISLLSCFSNQAKPGAQTIAPMLVLFWVAAMVLYVWYLILISVTDVIDSALRK